VRQLFDETLNLNRAAAGLNYTNQFVMGLNYTSVSLGGTRPLCTTLDNNNWIVDDKADYTMEVAVNARQST